MVQSFCSITFDIGNINFILSLINYIKSLELDIDVDVINELLLRLDIITDKGDYLSMMN